MPIRQASMTPAQQADAPAWWRVGMVWLVIGGPLVVVVASLCTMVVAIRGADERVDVPAEHAKTMRAATTQTPAMEARNHAATPQARTSP